MLDSDYRTALRRGWDDCSLCGGRGAFRLVTPDEAPPGFPAPYGIEGFCPRCGAVDGATAWHLALDTVEAQRFWRQHPRIRALPMRAVERDGRPVIVTGFQAVGAPARLDIVADARDYTVLLSDVSHTR